MVLLPSSCSQPQGQVASHSICVWLVLDLLVFRGVGLGFLPLQK